MGNATSFSGRTTERDATALGALAVVVVNHDSAEATLRCLASVWREEGDAFAIVVDNSNHPGEAIALQQALGTRAVVERMENRGFGAGCNRGIERALNAIPELSHVLLLNPDAELEPGALDALRATMARHPRCGAVGAKVVSMDGARVLFEHGAIRRHTLTRCHARAPADAGEESATEFITGACMLLDAGLLRQDLRFDEGYFLYGEDMDLCCAIAARGRSLWINRAAVVRHAEGGSQREAAIAGSMRARQLQWMTASKVRFARKWLTPWQRACFWFVAVLVKPLVGVVALRGLGFLRPYFAGLRAGLAARRDGWASPAPRQPYGSLPLSCSNGQPRQ